MCPENSLVDKEQTLVGEFFYFEYFFRGSLQRNALANFSIAKLDRSIKR